MPRLILLCIHVVGLVYVFAVLVSFVCALYRPETVHVFSKFLLLIFLFLPSTKTGFGYLNSCSYTDIDCQIIEDNSF
jgi:hypothetical protein